MPVRGKKNWSLKSPPYETYTSSSFLKAVRCVTRIRGTSKWETNTLSLTHFHFAGTSRKRNVQTHSIDMLTNILRLHTKRDSGIAHPGAVKMHRKWVVVSESFQLSHVLERDNRSTTPTKYSVHVISGKTTTVQELHVARTITNATQK